MPDYVYDLKVPIIPFSHLAPSEEEMKEGRYTLGLGVFGRHSRRHTSLYWGLGVAGHSPRRKGVESAALSSLGA